MSDRILGKFHNEKLHNLHSSSKYYQNDQTEEDEMGKECGKYSSDEKCVQK
jgi:hypothetical protein